MKAKVGQYINFEGILFTMRCLLKPQLFKPHYQVSWIADINFAALKHNQIKYIVFDKDNTLTIPYEKQFHHSIKTSIQECKEVYT